MGGDVIQENDARAEDGKRGERIGCHEEIGLSMFHQFTNRPLHRKNINKNNKSTNNDSNNINNNNDSVNNNLSAHDNSQEPRLIG